MRSEASQPEDRPRPPSICNAAGIYGIGKREREAVAPPFPLGQIYQNPFGKFVSRKRGKPVFVSLHSRIFLLI